METTNEHILRLLEMLDNPEAYTEQEIEDIINHDDDTREAYNLMVEAKRSSRRRKEADAAVDVDGAWQRFLGRMKDEESNRMTNDESRFARNDEYKLPASPESNSYSSFENDSSFLKDQASKLERVTRHSSLENDSSFVILEGSSEQVRARHLPFKKGAPLRKIAAMFIGVLLVSGIAFAAIRMVRQYQRVEANKAAVVEDTPKPSTTFPADTLASDTLAMQPVVYDNIPLEKMLTEIAAHYDVKVTFLSSEARELRFRFVWNPQQGIDQVVSDLNQFNRLKVTLKDNVITVE